MQSLRVLLIAGLLGLSGCATQVGFKDPGQRNAALTALRAGQANLGCSDFGCLVAWAGARPPAARLMQACTLQWTVQTGCLGYSGSPLCAGVG